MNRVVFLLVAALLNDVWLMDLRPVCRCWFSRFESSRQLTQRLLKALGKPNRLSRARVGVYRQVELRCDATEVRILLVHGLKEAARAGNLEACRAVAELLLGFAAHQGTCLLTSDHALSENFERAAVAADKSHRFECARFILSSWKSACGQFSILARRFELGCAAAHWKRLLCAAAKAGDTLLLEALLAYDTPPCG